MSLSLRALWRFIRPEKCRSGKPENFIRPLSAGNLFEARNIFGPVFASDEYQIGDTRFDGHDVIVDVGAHIGAFSYLCYTKGARAIYCYEPGGRNFRLLERNLGSLPGVHLSRAAVWRSDRVRPAELRLSGPAGENTGASSVLAGGRVVDFHAQTTLELESEPEAVTAIPLDDILESFDRVRLLKVDCEGSEFPILLTSNKLHKVEWIVAEIHEVGERCMELLSPESHIAPYLFYRLEDMVSRLESLGFDVKSRRGESHLHLISARRTHI
jgi:FkbM family methyltransferase